MNACFEATRDAIWEKRNKKGLLVGAHRGTSGGSIIQNTVPAFQNAVRHGADVVEVDALMSASGDFIAFHDGAEEEVFHTKLDLRAMTTDEILALVPYNSLLQPMQSMRVNRLDDVLEALKGKCLINVDRTWFYWKEIIACLNRHNMFDQLILKSHVETALLEHLEALGPKLMYMPIIKHQQNPLGEMETVWRYKLNVIAAEIIMVDPIAEASCQPLIQRLHQEKILAWINTLTLSDRITLSMWYDDNKAVMEGPEASWGWLMDKGYDIIQTDWPALLNEYVGMRR